MADREQIRGEKNNNSGADKDYLQYLTVRIFFPIIIILKHIRGLVFISTYHNLSISSELQLGLEENNRELKKTIFVKLQLQHFFFIIFIRMAFKTCFNSQRANRFYCYRNEFPVGSLFFLADLHDFFIIL